MKSVEALKKEGVKLIEVELMLTAKELQRFAQYCKERDIKFNDWIRLLAQEALDKHS